MSRLSLSLLVAVGATALALPVSSARADAFEDLSRRAYRVGVAALDAVDATPAQRRAVASAGSRLAHHLAPFEDDVRDWAHDAHAVWVAPTVDREAVEAVRVDAVELVDAASVGGVDFVVDVAEVLTPAQREALARRAWQRAKNLLGD